MNNIIDKIVYMTPNELDELGIGADTKTLFREDEGDAKFPILLTALKNLARESIYGTPEDVTDNSFPVEGSNSKGFMCIEINGKLCKLKEGEWNPHGFVKFKSTLPISQQTKIFQRLILSGQITLEDLAADDIATEVYKSLVVNELDGDMLYRQKIDQLDKLWEAQQNDKELDKLHQKVLCVLQ